MGIRTIAREHRLVAALAGLKTRSRASQVPATLIERQRRDHRSNTFDSSQPVAVLATVAALSAGEGVAGAAVAATGLVGGETGYYGSGGTGGGGFGGAPP